MKIIILLLWLLAQASTAEPLAAGPLAAGPLAAGPLTPHALLQSLSRVEHSRAAFQEVKHLAALTEPLVQRGVVEYRRPDYLKKHTLEPQPSSIEVRGSTLILAQPEQGRRELALDDYPVLQAFAESLRATLAGDMKTLQRHFEIRLSGNTQAWQLRLTPLSADLRVYIAAVLISGVDATVTRVETLETGGDRSVMTIQPD